MMIRCLSSCIGRLLVILIGGYCITSVIKEMCDDCFFSKTRVSRKVLSLMLSFLKVNPFKTGKQQSPTDFEIKVKNIFN